MASIHGYSQRLVAKLAGDAAIPGLFDVAGRAGDPRAIAPSDPANRPRLYATGGTAGMSNVGELAVATGSTIGGEFGGGVVASLLPILQIMGVDVRRLIQLGYGGNTERLNEIAKVNAAIGGQRFEQLGKALPQAIAGVSERLGIPEQGNWIAGQLAGAFDPRTVGMVAAQLFPMLPENVQNAIAGVTPQVLWDVTPLVSASYKLSGGRPNPQLADNIAKSFNSALADGLFGGVPATAAAQAYYTAVDRAGPVSMATVGRLVRHADQIVQTTGVPVGDAVEYLAQVVPPQALAALGSDPKATARVTQAVQGFATMYEQSGMTPEQFGGILSAAKQQGVPVALALRAQLSSERLGAKNLPGVDVGRYSAAERDYTMDLGRGDATKLLAWAQSKDPRAVEAALASYRRSGDAGALGRIIERYRMDGDAMARRGTVDTQRFLANAAAHSPELIEGLKTWELGAAMKRHGLSHLLNNKAFARAYANNPDAAAAQFRLTPQQQRALAESPRMVSGLLANSCPSCSRPRFGRLRLDIHWLSAT